MSLCQSDLLESKLLSIPTDLHTSDIFETFESSHEQIDNWVLYRPVNSGDAVYIFAVVVVNKFYSELLEDMSNIYLVTLSYLPCPGTIEVVLYIGMHN